MSIQTLYLVLERPRYRAWRGVVISKTTKTKPTLKRPSEQALVRLRIDIPDSIMEPRAVAVVIKPEDIVAPIVSVTAQPSSL